MLKSMAVGPNIVLELICSYQDIFNVEASPGVVVIHQDPPPLCATLDGIVISPNEGKASDNKQIRQGHLIITVLSLCDPQTQKVNSNVVLKRWRTYQKCLS
ncbi:hypothetical protein GOODEAATRI_027381 [Goodea atripinnis]|uniref:Uncharacterized protein n=1 Tax=Goodea atripinnis TaxID=208336 RepID=A0ABV0N634_9TELE